MRMSKIIHKIAPGLFDYDQRLEKLSKTAQPLERLDTQIAWDTAQKLGMPLVSPSAGDNGPMRE